MSDGLAFVDPYDTFRPEHLLDGGKCFTCLHGDAEHHDTAFPRWCGECRCGAYVPTSHEYLQAIVVLRRAARAVTQEEPRDA